MITDLEKAKEYLESRQASCVLCKDDRLHCSFHRGVRPLLDFLDSGEDFTGFSAADKVVGKATAFLYCLLGVTAVHAGVLSDSAAQVLADAKIAFSCDRQVSGIRNRDNTGPCPMENATKDIEDPREALLAIRETLRQLQK